MREGLLYFDNSPDRDLQTKIERVAAYYIEKYGAQPTLCFVHPTMLLDGPVQVEGIEIRATNSVLPSHFWMGVSDTSRVQA